MPEHRTNFTIRKDMYFICKYYGLYKLRLMFVVGNQLSDSSTCFFLSLYMNQIPKKLYWVEKILKFIWPLY